MSEPSSPESSVSSTSSSKKRALGKHTFVEKRFNTFTYCDFCKEFIWGVVGKQGLSCTACGFNSHRRCCAKVHNHPTFGLCTRERKSKSESLLVEEQIHDFQQVHFHQFTYCDYCGEFVWGLGRQGIHCNCGFNAHKKCMQKIIADPKYRFCVRQKKKSGFNRSSPGSPSSPSVSGDAGPGGSTSASTIDGGDDAGDAPSSTGGGITHLMTAGPGGHPGGGGHPHSHSHGGEGGAIESDHIFVTTRFSSFTWCEYCKDFIWGLGRQGKQCTVCGMAAHFRCVKKISSHPGFRICLLRNNVLSQSGGDAGSNLQSQMDSLRIDGSSGLHRFEFHPMRSPTMCAHCGEIIWSAHDGFVCQCCAVVVHRSCMEDIVRDAELSVCSPRGDRQNVLEFLREQESKRKTASNTTTTTTTTTTATTPSNSEGDEGNKSHFYRLRSLQFPQPCTHCSQQLVGNYPGLHCDQCGIVLHSGCIKAFNHSPGANNCSMHYPQYRFSSKTFFPDNVWIQIFQHLPIAHIGLCATVCIDWHARSTSPLLWKLLLQSIVGNSVKATWMWTMLQMSRSSTVDSGLGVPFKPPVSLQGSAHPLTPMRLNHLSVISCLRFLISQRSFTVPNKLAGGMYSAAVSVDGQGFVWGKDVLSNPPSRLVSDGFEPRPVLRSEKLSMASVGHGHLACVTQNGSLHIWGFGGDGQIGNGLHMAQTDSLTTAAPANIAIPLDGPRPSRFVSFVHCSRFLSMAVTDTGQLYSWGSGACFALGHGDSSSIDTPRRIERLAHVRVTSAAAGINFALALTDRDVWGWGDGSRGKLGRALGEHESIVKLPTPIPFFANSCGNIVQLSCGGESSFALSDSGKLYAFGSGTFGELGRGDSADCLVPTAVEFFADYRVTCVSSGYFFGACCVSDGSLYTWGCVKREEVERIMEIEEADEDIDEDDDYEPIIRKRPLPTMVESMKGKRIVHVSAGGWHALVIDSHGQMYSFGDGSCGRLGTGVEVTVDSPAVIPALEGSRMRFWTGEYQSPVDPETRKKQKVDALDEIFEEVIDAQGGFMDV